MADPMIGESAPPIVPETRTWAGQPAGLSTLFFTEMWERFSYYGMRALLILYLTASVVNGGAGFDTAKAASIYGWYTFGVYAAAIPGGWLADRFLGQYRSVLFGGILIALGHFSLAFGSIASFYGGLGLIIAGTGLLKPNISAMVGSLYHEGDPRRDGGFSIFYMGINLGAFIAPLVCGTLGQKVGWHWGFGAAGIGMTLGLIQYVLGRQRLASALTRIEGKKKVRNETTATAQVRRFSFTPMEWKRIGAIGIFFVFSALFWAAFEQGGSSLNLFADRLTRTSLFGFQFPSTWFQSLNSLYILMLAPLFAWLWVRLRKHEPSSPVKFSIGLLFVGLGFLLLVPASMISGPEQKLVSPFWLVGVYFFHTVGELCLSPVGLSVVTKLAPPQIVGRMMGLWFLSTALGNKVGGWVAGLFDTLPLPQLFGAVFATTTAAAILLAILIKPVRRLMGGVH